MTTTTTSSRGTSLTLALCVVAALGCDKSGVNDLGEANDVNEQFTTIGSTWVRSVDDDYCPDLSAEPTLDERRRCAHGPGTEIFSFDKLDVANDPEGRYLFNFGTVHDESTTHMVSGELVIGADGTGTALISREYIFRFQPTISSPLGREGAVREEHDPPLERPVALSTDGGQMVLEWDGLTRRATALNVVLERIDITTQAGEGSVSCRQPRFLHVQRAHAGVWRR